MSDNQQYGSGTPGTADGPTLGEHLSSPRTHAAMRVQTEALAGAREFLRAHSFTELLPPLIGPVTDPGGRGAKALEVDYYGRPYKLMTSAILYKQAALAGGFGKIFFIAPNVRVEPPETADTGRHLVEFHQIDIEMAHASRTEAMETVAALLAHVVGYVVENAADALERLGRDPLAFAELLTGKYDVLTHAEAVGSLPALGHAQDPGAEIGWQAEEALSAAADRPFFITDYPKGSRGFYDSEDPERPGVLRNFDFIAPGGFGELSSGSERTADYATLVTRMRESGENPAKYDWYLKMARGGGMPPSAGFGLGLERVVRFLTGLDAVWQVSAYPKLPGVMSA